MGSFAHDGSETGRRTEAVPGGAEQILAAILNSCTDSIAAVDRDLRLIACNRAANEEFVRLYGAPIELGSPLESALGAAPQDLVTLRDLWKRALDGDEFRVVRELGNPPVAFELRFGGSRDTAGTVTAAFCIGRRIAAGLQPDEQFRSLAENLPQLCWMADADGWIFWYNRRWYEYTGTTPQQMQGWGWERVHDPAILPHVVERWKASIASGEPFEMVFPLRGADAVFRPFLTRIVPVRDAVGRVARWFGTNTDISDERRIRQALEASEERYRLLSEAAPVHVWTCTAEGHSDFLNSRWVAYTGIPAEQQLGEAWLDNLHPEDSARVRQAFAGSDPENAVFDLELRIQGADGRYRWFASRARPLRDESGRVVRWFGTNTDIHDLKTAEQALRRANENLEQFAYIAAHDLQEPLRTVITFSQLAQRRAGPQLDDESQQCLNYVAGAAARMSDLIRDVLAYSHANSNQRHTRGQVDLAAIVRESIRDLASRVEECGAEVLYDSLPIVRGEAGPLQQVFDNLIGNALKYRRATVRCRVEIGARPAADGWIVWVRDNGVGFRQEYADQIFGIFKRLHGKQVPGSGIGLAICKAIIERHGGRIWAESAENIGTTVYMTLPAAAPALE